CLRTRSSEIGLGTSGNFSKPLRWGRRPKNNCQRGRELGRSPLQRPSTPISTMMFRS
ncbi:MAG: hypothetical protein AVDCRST_MAG44-649, partial [uncultured Sphingomonas sp.]